MAKRGFPITKQMRAERRKRADEANKEYNSKYPTLQDKLNALPANGANKQRAKLQSLVELEKQKESAAVQAAIVKTESKLNKKVKKQ